MWLPCLFFLNIGLVGTSGAGQGPHHTVHRGVSAVLQYVVNSHSPGGYRV